MNDSLKRLTEKSELVDAIKGGGTAHQSSSTSNGYNASNPVLVMGTNPENFSSASSVDQSQLSRAFLQSAMAQNIKIQQQLLAQNQALQTLLSQQDTTGQSTSPTSSSSNAPKQQSSFKSRARASVSSFNGDFDRNRKSSSDSSHIPPPPPPPMPPPIELNDPSAARPFLDPYGRFVSKNHFL